jgi:hypothetical protein
MRQQSGVCHDDGRQEVVDLCRSIQAEGLDSAGVVGYVPLRDGAARLVLKRGERTLHSVAIPHSRPRVEVVAVDVDDERMSVRWHAEHDRQLNFNVVFIDGRGRAFPVARELPEGHFERDLADLPGGRGCSVAVLATDGLRSAMARSGRFDLPDRPPRLLIAAPLDGETLVPDQPISLIGAAVDLAGIGLADEGLLWTVDGETVGRGERIASAGPLEPGEHVVELAWSGQGQEARSRVRVTVADRSPEQRDWLSLSSRGR